MQPPLPHPLLPELDQQSNTDEESEPGELGLPVPMSAPPEPPPPPPIPPDEATRIAISSILGENWVIIPGAIVARVLADSSSSDDIFDIAKNLRIVILEEAGLRPQSEASQDGSG